MILLIVIGMSLATMIPRLVPVFIVDRLEFRPWLNRWLAAIPYAALGALIFPGILFVRESSPVAGILGGLFALLLSLFRLNIVLIVIGAILFMYFYPA
ncbi:AzlD domain-containing protein [Aciduricibacillus chroicocephali]|uniref:AzlD domain-containing protein n=1 Tax=Aciduricibacillus chroicocephali TaxID=3054939 RepID=A0ABY9KXC1_9BACI|nr:AzlD domain-containing protein [Bacillaceae bacterium 44XB]